MAVVTQLSISPGGIPKRAIREARLTPLGLEGDLHAHPKFHGGPLQAVLVITNESLDEMRAAGYDVYPGALGENLTTVGLDRRDIRLGQRYRIGAQAIIEITKMRVPCATLDIFNTNGAKIQKDIFDPKVKAGDPTSPRWGLAGFYASVASTGLLFTNDIIELLDQAV